MASVWLCQLERLEGLRNWVSLSIRMLMRGRGGEDVLLRVRWAKHSWEVLYLIRKHQMFDTIIQVRGEERSSRVEMKTFSTFENLMEVMKDTSSIGSARRSCLRECLRVKLSTILTCML